MDGNKTVSANFNLIEGGNIDVSVRKTAWVFGKVVSIEDSKINCGSKCSGSYESKLSTLADHGGEVFEYASFKAVPERGSSFVGWRGGDCLKSTRKDMRKDINVCYVTLSGGNKIIVADFSEGSKNPRGKYFDLSVTVSAGGVVTSADGKINCGSGNTLCTYSYGKNIAVTLTATPNSGYIFLNAGGSLDGCSGRNNINTCDVKMMKNQNVKFYFGASGSSSSSSSSASAKPTATTGSATGITSNFVTLNGTVNPQGRR